LNAIKTRTIDNPLNEENRRKYAIITNIVSNSLLTILFVPLFVFISIGISVMNYMENHCLAFHQRIIWVVLWSLPTVSFTLQLFGEIFGGALFWFLSMIYVNMQYIEINTAFKKSLLFRHRTMFIKLIEKHRQITKNMFKLNKLMHGIMFTLITMYTSLLILGLYVSIDEKTSHITRIVFISLTILFVTLLFTVFSTSAVITRNAHKSRSLIHSFVVRSPTLKTRERLALDSFNGRLSGPDIGFYCLDMFAMNNNNFCDYCLKFIYYFLLILQLKS
jgi:hypothetical protein